MLDSYEPVTKRSKTMDEDSIKMCHVAVAGCSHGELDVIYQQLHGIEVQRNIKFDLLICCGDFQANRNYGDLHYFQSPLWHKKLKTFHKYYSGAKVAPILTIFVGGNHESPAFLAELPNGGWVAPNIFYMGYASVINFAGLRIAGLSGIYKSHDFNKGHFERPPFTPSSSVSAYHVRSIDTFRLKQLKGSNKKIDIFVSHDWPAGITDYGDRDRLLRIKPHFTSDLEKNTLGNPATMELLYELQPLYWFSAHMHVKFNASVNHETSGDQQPRFTKFVALDKPVFIQKTRQLDRRRCFLEFFEFPTSSEHSKNELQYDPEWLAILKNTDSLMELTNKTVYMPSMLPGSSERFDFSPSNEELEAINEQFNGNFEIPRNFQLTAPIQSFHNDYNVNVKTILEKTAKSLYYRNPQSTIFCQKLGITDLNGFFADAAATENFLGIPQYYLDRIPNENNAENANAVENELPNPDEIDIDIDEFGDESFIIDP